MTPSTEQGKKLAMHQFSSYIGTVIATLKAFGLEKNFLWRDVRSQVPVSLVCIPNMIKHSLAAFSLLAESSNLCRHELIRSAEICKENSFKHTCLQPTHMVCCKSKSNINHIHSIQVHPRLHLIARSHKMYNTQTTIERGNWDATDSRRRVEAEDFSEVTLLAHELTDICAQRVKPKTLKRGIQSRIPRPPPLFPAMLLLAHPPQPTTDQHMWWRMTHLFFYKGCVYVKLLKCIKMSSTLGGPPRLPWKITIWKYNFSTVEPEIWTEFCLCFSYTHSLPSLFVCCLFLFFFFFYVLLFSYIFSVCAHITIRVGHFLKAMSHRLHTD